MVRMVEILRTKHSLHDSDITYTRLPNTQGICLQRYIMKTLLNASNCHESQSQLNVIVSILFAKSKSEAFLSYIQMCVDQKEL